MKRIHFNKIPLLIKRSRCDKISQEGGPHKMPRLKVHPLEIMDPVR